MKDNITKEQIRIRLPGYRVESVLVQDKNQTMKLVFELRGVFDDLIEVLSYQIFRKDGRCDVYTTINEAYQAWDKI